MEKVSVSKLKNQLSAYLKKAERGQTVIVTDRNKPIAQLTAVSAAGSENERIAALVAQGILSPAKLPPLSIEEIRRMRVVAPGAGVLEALLEERREGR
ncbi:MAG: type II toxin-antitoxin system Phd/YefM family antitoxin [Steroidobacteraceae bacterium]